jgi:hypothetical protein
MSNGYTIYNGPRKEIPSFYAKFGVKIKENYNHADFLIRVAIYPDEFR